MGKNRKGRRRGDEDLSAEEEEEEEDDNQRDNVSSSPNKKNMDFKQRRDVSRREAAEKRRLKMKCHLCGKAGHVRRDCPGIADDGRGESKYKSAKGDVGAKYKKKKGERGQKASSSKESDEHAHASANAHANVHENLVQMEMPPGFDPPLINENSNDTEVVVEEDCDDLEKVNGQFFFYDAGTDGAAAIHHLQTRVGDTKAEAIHDYRSATQHAKMASNYGGCIAQHYMKTNQPWDSASLPSPWAPSTTTTDNDDAAADGYNNATTEEEEQPQPQPQPPWFVLGLSPGWNCSDDDQEALDFLLQAISTGAKTTTTTTATTPAATTRIVGLCATLDYSKLQDRQLHLTRAWCTCKAAMEANLPIQLRLLPACKDAATKDNADSPYAILMSDVEGILDKITETNAATQVHLSRWSGHADTMTHLLRRFPKNIWIGMDGTVTFQKATRAHECAFDVPLNRLLLETGTTIPSQVALQLGRDAFVHGGWIPFVAESMARCKKDISSTTTTAEVVARVASQNTNQVYGLFGAGTQ